MNWRIRQHRPVVRSMRREQRLPNILTYLDIASTAGRMQLEFRADQNMEIRFIKENCVCGKHFHMVRKG